MGIFQQFPYSNFHEMNLDQIIKIMREMQDEWANTKAEWASYKDFIDNYFANLDLSEEVLQALKVMAADGSLATVMDPTIAAETAAWLADHITQPTSPAIDTSLSVAGAAADAKVTGDNIRMIRDTWLNLFNREMIIPNTFIDGTTGALSPSNLYDASTPIQVKPNTSYTIKTFTCTGAPYYRIYYYKSDLTYISRLLMLESASPNGFVFNTPADCYYVRLNFESAANTSGYQDYTTCVLVEGSTTLTEYINHFTAQDLFARTNGLIYKGSLANNTDLNDVQTIGIYSIDSGNTYINSPYAAGTLMVVALSTYITIQFAVQLSTGDVVYRRRLGPNWLDWILYDSHDTLKNGVMFGDSLAYGEVYPVGDSPFQADAKYRIPTRIAKAINIDTMINQAVGGSGFVYTGYEPVTIVNKIKQSNLSLYDIMIVSGGRNDSSIALGTAAGSVIGDGTICGAVKDIIDYVQTNFPKLQVVWIQTTPNTYFGDVFTGVTSGGWSLNNMKNEIGAICAAASIPYITWEDLSIIRQWTDLCGNGSQFAHPATEDVYRKLGNYLGGQVSKYYLNN